MNAPVSVELVGPDAAALSAAASLHSRCLVNTVTSARGEEVLQRSYHYLASCGHPIYLLVAQNLVIGGLVLLGNRLPHSPMKLLFLEPTSWFRALRRLGVGSLCNQLWDLLQVRRQTRDLLNCDYITALYVDETERRRGRARQLLTRVIADSQTRGVRLVVDTHLSNVAARQFYSSLGFVEHGRTRCSVILTLGVD